MLVVSVAILPPPTPALSPSLSLDLFSSSIRMKKSIIYAN